MKSVSTSPKKKEEEEGGVEVSKLTCMAFSLFLP